MAPDSALLDLADLEGWLPSAKAIAEHLVSEGVRTELKGFDPEEMFDDTMSFLVEACIRHGEYRDGQCVEVEDWSADFDAAFRNRYSHIRAFHACRAFAGVDSYKRKGIRKLSRGLLRKLAHLAFANYSTREEIDKVVDEADIPAFEKSVYVFTDAIHPLDHSCNHYLQSGSEMLQALSISLGIHSRGILAAQGVPYLIECNVPLEHVSTGFRCELWRKLVTEFFRVEAGATPPKKPYDFCLRVTHSIAPQSIRGFHEINGKIRSIVPNH